MKPLAIFYGQFIQKHRGQPPANEAEFRQYVRSVPADRLKSFEVTEADSIFTSSRDGKPYVVIYGPVTRDVAESPNRVIAYEQAGRWGKRYVAFSTGKIEEVSEDRFKQLVPEKP